MITFTAVYISLYVNTQRHHEKVYALSIVVAVLAGKREDKAGSNMTLETIARLENALSIDLVKSALTYVSGYGSTVPSRPQYLSDSAGEKLDPNIKTSDLVDGYKHR